MAGPEGNHDPNKDSSNAAFEALSNAARAYASLAPNLAAAGAFPPGLGLDASALMMNPAAAVAAVAAAAAKHLAAQGINNTATQTAPPTITAPPGLAAQFGHTHHTHHTHHTAHNHTANATSQAAALAAAASLLPGALNPSTAGALQPPAAGSLQGNAALNHVAALLQSVSQQVTQVQHAHTMAASAPQPPPPPPPPPSYSPQPPPQQPQYAPPRTASEPPRVAATSHNSYPGAVQVVAAHAAPKPTPSSALLPNIQNWSLEQLENHVNMLQQMKQPVPQSIALLLADACRKEEKKTAKRVANRKSACTSRARKKALVEEMTRTNARLRRQALILSLLPDLVIVISQDGEITFCSAQVERVLRHKIDDLIGSDIRDILIPTSRTALGKLISQLMNPSDKPSAAAVAERRSRRAARGGGNQQDAGGRRRDNKARDEENGNVSGASSGSGGASSGAAAVVSDQSFPLSVVKVDSKQDPPSDENENSDASGVGGKEPVISSLSNSTARSPSASLANSGSDPEDGARAGAGKEDGDKKDRISPAAKKESSDDSSSGSTETKNIRKANENLEWNVRWHNKKLQSMSKSAKEKPGHKDDVLGDSVTPNNALARLSSLQHYPDEGKPPAKKRKKFDSIGDRSSSEDSLTGIDEEKKKSANNENASDDSGYRESNDSREETSSSASESSNSNGRNKPLAPTCNVCLIRDDLTTLWCEVTSSIRTRSVEDDTPEEAPPANGIGIGSTKVAAAAAAAAKSGASKTSKASTVSSDDAPVEAKVPETKELLLCLRPIRDGDGEVDESLRFSPRRLEGSNSPIPSSGLLTGDAEACRAVSNADLSDSNGNADATIADDPGNDRKRPHKKRALPLQHPASSEPGTSTKRTKVKQGPSSSDDTEQSVVESLMLMSHKSN